MLSYDERELTTAKREEMLRQLQRMGKAYAFYEKAALGQKKTWAANGVMRTAKDIAAWLHSMKLD